MISHSKFPGGSWLHTCAHTFRKKSLVPLLPKQNTALPLECRLPSRTCCLPSCRGQAIRHRLWLSSAFSLSQRWIYFHRQIWWRQGLLPNSGMFFARHSTSRLERRSRGNMTFHAKPSLFFWNGCWNNNKQKWDNCNKNIMKLLRKNFPRTIEIILPVDAPMLRCSNIPLHLEKNESTLALMSNSSFRSIFPSPQLLMLKVWSTVSGKSWLLLKLDLTPLKFLGFTLAEAVDWSKRQIKTKFKFDLRNISNRVFNLQWSCSAPVIDRRSATNEVIYLSAQV